MESEAEMKAWIDAASYEDLLRKWRFAPAGDPMFSSSGSVAGYFERVMREKRLQIGDAEHTRVSKAIGWDR